MNIEREGATLLLNLVCLQQFPPGPRPGPAVGGGGGGPGPGGPGPQHPAAGGGGPPGQHPGAPGGGQMTEMDMLRRTLFEFLTENEALRSALHESNMPMEPRGGGDLKLSLFCRRLLFCGFRRII